MPKKWLAALIIALALGPAPGAGAGCGDGNVDGDTGCGGSGSGSGSGALFRFQGRDFYEEDLDLRVRESLHALAVRYHEDRRLLLDNALWQVFLAAEAGRLNKEREQVAMELIKPAQPTEAAMAAFYEANKNQIDAPYEQVKQKIAQFLLQQQVLEARSKLMADIKKEGRFTLLIDPPRAPVAVIDTAGFPSRGSKLAPVEVVEFADYQCPHCKTAHAIMQRLEKRYGDDLRLVFMDFPINRSGISRRVATGAVCADRQGRFWEYHAGAYELQDSLSAQSPMELAARIGLDSQRFSDCLTGAEADSKVARSKAEAVRLGLDSTPSFFVNGLRLNPRSDLEQELIEAIDRALE